MRALVYPPHGYITDILIKQLKVVVLSGSGPEVALQQMRQLSIGLLLLCRDQAMRCCAVQKESTR